MSRKEIEVSQELKDLGDPLLELVIPAEQVSKSAYLKILECPLHCWLALHGIKPIPIESEYDAMVKAQGYEVEAKAKQFLEAYVAETYPPGSKIEFEVTMIDGKFEARIDALVFNSETQKYDLYKIKSGKNS